MNIGLEQLCIIEKNSFEWSKLENSSLQLINWKTVYS